MAPFTAILFNVLAVALAITAHEFIKAAASTVLGDTMPKKNGRLTINPLKHLDPIGFIFMIAYGYGWANPVQTSSTYYRDRKKGTLITYILPSVFNLLLAVCFALAFHFIAFAVIPGSPIFMFLIYMGEFLYACISANISFALINLIPVYPFDGAKILSVYMSPNASLKLSYSEKILQIIFLFALFFGVINSVLSPIRFLIMRILNVA